MFPLFHELHQPDVGFLHRDVLHFDFDCLQMHLIPARSALRPSPRHFNHHNMPFCATSNGAYSVNGLNGASGGQTQTDKWQTLIYILHASDGLPIITGCSSVMRTGGALRRFTNCLSDWTRQSD